MDERVELTVVGAINLDLTAKTQCAPGPGETVADGVLTRGPGGKGANQAIAASRLGASVRLIGAVGDDDDGRALTMSLAAGGVDVSGVQTVGHPTGTALIVVDAEGENSIVVCPGANSHIDPSRALIDPHGAVLAQREVDDSLLEQVGAGTDGFFALNASPSHPLPASLEERVDLFIVNEQEYSALPGLASAPLTVVTLGARGAVLLRAGEEIARGRADATHVRNTVGAGDSFAAALVVGMLRGDDHATALQRACAVGAVAVADPASQPALAPLSGYPATLA